MLIFKKISPKEWKAQTKKYNWYITLYESPNLGIKTYTLLMKGDKYFKSIDFRYLNEAKKFAKNYEIEEDFNN